MISPRFASQELSPRTVLLLLLNTLPRSKTHHELRYRAAASLYPVSRRLDRPSLRHQFSTITAKPIKSSHRPHHRHSRHFEKDESEHAGPCTAEEEEESPSLNEQQQHVFDLVIKEKKSIFFTGPAGTGKSFLLKKICAELKNKYGPSEVAITASTGLAAHHIEGGTLHRFAGIALGTAPAEFLITKIRGEEVPAEFLLVSDPFMNNNEHWERTRFRWTAVRVLVIDEVSMVDAALFDKLDHIARAVREIDQPFGGIQLVISGDFYQLPPVTPDLKDDNPRFCFEAHAWKTAIQHTIELTRVYRQKDPKLATMLNKMREGSLSPETIATFKGLHRPLRINHSNHPEPTQLFPLRRQAESANNERLWNLKTPTYTYTAKEKGTVKNEVAREKLLSNFIAPRVLHIKEGAWVMLIRNRTDGRMNGSQGRVVGFGKWEERDPWERGLNLESVDGPDHGETLFPLVHFGTKSCPKLISPVLWVKQRWVYNPPDEEDEKRDPHAQGCWKVEVLASRVQVPLILAWALSIHKSQGQSLDYVKVDLGHVFETGQAYVALSRAKTIEGLQVLNFDDKKVAVHPKVKEFYKTLSRGTEEENIGTSITTTNIQ